MNMQKGSDKDVSIKNKLALESRRISAAALKAAAVASDRWMEIDRRVHTVAPEDRAPVKAECKLAKAEYKKKYAEYKDARKAASKASAEATAAYEAAYPEEAKARAVKLAPALAAAGNNVAARAAVYGKAVLESRPSVNAARTEVVAFARNYLQTLGNAGNISANHPEVANAIHNASEAARRLIDYGSANTEETPAKDAADRGTLSHTDSNDDTKAGDKRFTRQ